MANIHLSSLLEAFAFATGAPPSVWRAVPVLGGPVVQPKARIDDVKQDPDIEYLDLPLIGQPEAGNHGE